MFKYAFILIHNKEAAKAIVKNCRQQYNKNLVGYRKEEEETRLKNLIKKACHNWLYMQMMAIINTRKNQTTLSV